MSLGQRDEIKRSEGIFSKWTCLCLDCHREDGSRPDGGHKMQTRQRSPGQGCEDTRGPTYFNLESAFVSTESRIYVFTLPFQSFGNSFEYSS